MKYQDDKDAAEEEPVIAKIAGERQLEKDHRQLEEAYAAAVMELEQKANMEMAAVSSAVDARA